jgi:hypothetical protein
MTSLECLILLEWPYLLEENKLVSTINEIEYNWQKISSDNTTYLICCQHVKIEWPFQKILPAIKKYYSYETLKID